MKPLLFIVNRQARGGKNKQMEQWLKDALQRRQLHHEVRGTNSEEEVEALVRRAVDRNYYGIVSVGGDGSASQLLRTLHRYDMKLAMGMISNGTGNDVQRTLKLPKDRDEALDLILNSEERPIDYGLANGVPFLNSASIGYDPQVIVIVNEVKQKIPSRLAYIWSVLAALRKYEEFTADITWDNGHLKVPFYVFSVANGKYYGGGFTVAPMASMDDGVFHMALLHADGPKSKLPLLFKVVQGKHLAYKKQVVVEPTEQVTFDAEGDILLNLDGELSYVQGPITFENIPGGIKFLGIPHKDV